MAKFYTVTKGHKTGVFDTWTECQAQTNGYSGAVFKSYNTREEAENALRNGIHSTPTNQSHIQSKEVEEKPLQLDYIANSISVDAACANNPGVTEYQAVMTGSDDKLFHSKIYESGTNNVGEFLALVHAMQYRKEHNLDIPIYSDSDIGLGWIFKQRMGSKLVRNDKSKEILDDVDLALEWLRNNPEQYFDILKWDTEAWGESKADFGRK